MESPEAYGLDVPPRRFRLKKYNAVQPPHVDLQPAKYITPTAPAPNKKGRAKNRFDTSTFESGPGSGESSSEEDSGTGGPTSRGTKSKVSARSSKRAKATACKRDQKGKARATTSDEEEAWPSEDDDNEDYQELNFDELDGDADMSEDQPFSDALSQVSSNEDDEEDVGDIHTPVHTSREVDPSSITSASASSAPPATLDSQSMHATEAIPGAAGASCGSQPASAESEHTPAVSEIDRVPQLAPAATALPAGARAPAASASPSTRLSVLATGSTTLPARATPAPPPTLAALATATSAPAPTTFNTPATVGSGDPKQRYVFLKSLSQREPYQLMLDRVQAQVCYDSGFYRSVLILSVSALAMYDCDASDSNAVGCVESEVPTRP